MTERQQWRLAEAAKLIELALGDDDGLDAKDPMLVMDGHVKAARFATGHRLLKTNPRKRRRRLVLGAVRHLIAYLGYRKVARVPQEPEEEAA